MSSNQKRKTVTGTQAITRIVRKSTDQVIGSIKERYTGKSAALNIARDFKLLKSMMNTELKQVYTLPSAQSVNNSTSLVYGIGTMAQGTASNQRSGDSVKISRIDLTMRFRYGNGTVPSISNQTFNWYLLRYLKTPSAAGTTAFNINEFLITDGDALYTPLSFPNTDTNQNFQIMSSGTLRIDLDLIPAANCSKAQTVVVSHDCSFHQDYAGSASTTITNNMCFMVFTALSAANTGGQSDVMVNAVMWYVDN